MKLNWWWLPVVVLAVWRAWAAGELWLYGPVVVLGLLGGVWLNRRADAAAQQRPPGLD